MYEWRANFGNAAIRAFEAFFLEYAEEFSTSEARSEFCKKILVKGRLFYEDPSSDVQVV